MKYLQHFHTIKAPIIGLLWFALQLRITCTTPPPGFVKKPDTDVHPPKYEFGYEVRDGGGGRQGHLEARDGVYALGKYYVRLPNGSDQKVNYYVDDWGYHPLVEYNNASPSSSSSAQFAMGEKAVAALVKTLSEAKPTEVTNILMRLSHKEGSSSRASSTSSSSYSSSISPAVTEKYSNTVLSSSTPNSLTSDSSESELLTNSQVSAASPSYAEQQTHIVTVTAETPSTLQNSHSVSAPSLTTQEQFQTLNYRANSENQFTSSQYATVSDINTNAPHDSYLNFESKKYSYLRPETSNYVDEAVKDSTERVVTIGGNYRYHSESQKPSNQNSVNVGGDGHKGSIQVTSYLANSEEAIDVSSNGENKRLPPVPQSESGGATTISAFLIAEDDRSKLEYNDIRRENQHVHFLASTTEPPNHFQKESFGPIIVPNHPKVSSSSYYVRKFSPNTKPIQYQDAEEINRIQTYDQYNSSRSDENEETVTEDFKSLLGLNRYDISPTPVPTPEPVLVTPREEATQLTSSDQVLAPIQAAVSLSTLSSESDSQDQDDEINKTIDSMEPIVEKQMLEEQSVYKTTIDVQKSIPYEITENNSEDQENHQRVIGINQPTSSPPYQQGTYLPIHQSINNEFSKDSNEQNLSSNNNQFIQQVLMAYQKLSSNEGKLEIPVNNAEGIQIHPTQIPPAVPNNLYYIYLQRFNPTFDRYGVQPQQHLFYQLPRQTTLQPQSTTLIPSGYIFNNLHSPPLLNQERTKLVHDPLLTNGFSNPASLEQKYYSTNFDKNLKNSGNVMSNIKSGFGIKTKFTSPLQFIKGKPKAGTGVASGNRDASNQQSDGIQNIYGGLNLNRYLNRPFNTLSSNNQNLLSSSTYQKYTDSSAANIRNLEARENINAFDKQNSGFAVNEQNLENLVPNSNIGQTIMPFQEQKYPEVNILDDSGRLIQNGGYTIQNVHVTNPTAIPQNPLTLHTIPVKKVIPIPVYPTVVPVLQGQLRQNIVPVAQPVALTYPQQINVPSGQSIPLSQVVPEGYKQFQPIYIYDKNDNTEFQRKAIDSNDNQPPFRPSQKLYHSVYPPETYYVTEYLKTNSKTRGQGKKLCIEYGGFKPPLIPSIQIDEKLEQTLEKKSDIVGQN